MRRRPRVVAVPPRAQPSAWPVHLGRVHGRDEVIARIQAQLPQQRLISIVGPGGIGKTTVASTLADAVSGAYPDGIQWVDLATLDRDETVPAATAFALGLDNFATDPTSGIVTTLRDRRMLLILDCCERVVRGAARIADSVLRGAPHVHMLATSRERLRTAGEYVVRLPPLGAPVPTGELTVEQAMEYPAVQLFVERATAALDSFILTEANLPTVMRICTRLEGIALAIELAAGSLAVLRAGAVGKPAGGQTSPDGIRATHGTAAASDHAGHAGLELWHVAGTGAPGAPAHGGVRRRRRPRGHSRGRGRCDD